MNSRGFTLLEVLIALAVLALGLPILLGLRNFDLGLHAQAGDIVSATLLAQDKLIETEMTPEFPLGETTGDFLRAPLGTASTTERPERAETFRWKRLVTSTPLPNVREVKIQVIWPGTLSDEMVEISTYVISATPF